MLSKKNLMVTMVTDAFLKKCIILLKSVQFVQAFLVMRCIRSHISFFRLRLTPTLRQSFQIWEDFVFLICSPCKICEIQSLTKICLCTEIEIQNTSPNLSSLTDQLMWPLSQSDLDRSSQFWSNQIKHLRFHKLPTYEQLASPGIFESWIQCGQEVEQGIQINKTNSGWILMGGGRRFFQWAASQIKYSKQPWPWFSWAPLNKDFVWAKIHPKHGILVCFFLSKIWP